MGNRNVGLVGVVLTAIILGSVLYHSGIHRFNGDQCRR